VARPLYNNGREEAGRAGFAGESRLEIEGGAPSTIVADVISMPAAGAVVGAANVPGLEYR
jgi:hypothetical protein